MSPPQNDRSVGCDGLDGTENARLDIQWSEQKMSSFRYVDDDDGDVNWRFSRHPNAYSPEIYLCPPSETATTDAEPSCLMHSQRFTCSTVVMAVSSHENSEPRAVYSHPGQEFLLYRSKHGNNSRGSGELPYSAADAASLRVGLPYSRIGLPASTTEFENKESR
ncbi:MAG: hypothetical protein J07HQX50_00245 [Haloquadratum sp. J07HQX50]|nr:MAG: hypothetical protein J07HQX50_00245 [Haloquadratum sp. J07HQX50]